MHSYFAPILLCTLVVRHYKESHLCLTRVLRNIKESGCEKRLWNVRHNLYISFIVIECEWNELVEREVPTIYSKSEPRLIMTDGLKW